MKKVFILMGVIVLLIFGINQKALAWWTYLQDRGTPWKSYYLGDKLTDQFMFAINQDTYTSYAITYGLGTTTDGTNWTWRSAEYDSQSGNDRYWKAKANEHTFTTAGNWYYSGRFVWTANNYTEYASAVWAENRTTLTATSYFTVDALSNPTDPSATVASSSQINLSWTQWNSKNVMILRKKLNQSWTEPTQGNSYAVNDNIGDAVVVYNGDGTSFNSASLASSTSYDYKLYSVNNDYYSGGAVVSASTQTAATDRFRSKMDGNWTDASTWESSSDNSIWVSATLSPSSTATSIIIANAVILTTDETASALTINASKSLTINSDKSLTVNGAFSNSGTVTIKSTASGTASLITNGTVSGDVTVERYIVGYTLPTNGWHLLSSPVASFVISGSPFEPGMGTDDLFSWDEAAGYWYNYEQNEGPDDIIPGEGYLVAYNTTATKNFSGAINNDDITLTNLSYTTASTNTGWHLLGNPFPSAITWGTSNWSLSNIDATAKIWSESSASYIDVNQNGVIPAMQGFFVRVSSGTNSITIPKADRTHSATNWYKGNDVNKLKLTAYDIEGSTAQQTIISFNEQATTGYDSEYDSYFMTGYAPLFYTSIDGKPASTNTLPELTEELSLPIYFRKNDFSNFVIKMEGLESLTLDSPVYLTDQKTGTTINFREVESYSFSAEDGDAMARFLLHFKAVGISSPAPIQKPLVNFINGELQVSNVVEGKVDVRVVDITGRVVVMESFHTAAAVNMPLNVQTGIYIVEVAAENGKFANKIYVK
jgi:hypothetical protein